MKTRKTGGTSVELALRQLCGPDDAITSTHADDEAKFQGRGPQNYALPMRRWPARELWRWVKGDRSTFRGRSGRALQEHMYAVRLRDLYPEAWNGYFKFSIERNPWDRQVSWYYWRTRNSSERLSFKDFMHQSENNPIVRNWDVYAIDGRVAVDRVLRFENLAEDFAAVMDHMGVRDVPELGSFKVGIRPRSTTYRSYYDDETRQIVADWYKRDIAAFGYEF